MKYLLDSHWPFSSFISLTQWWVNCGILSHYTQTTCREKVTCHGIKSQWIFTDFPCFIAVFEICIWTLQISQQFYVSALYPTRFFCSFYSFCSLSSSLLRSIHWFDPIEIINGQMIWYGSIAIDSFTSNIQLLPTDKQRITNIIHLHEY